MAQDGFSKRNDGAWEHDAAAFLPEPNGYIKVGGEEYPVFSFLDIPVEESMKCVQLSERIEKTEDMSDRMSLSIAHLLILNAGPDSGREGRKILTEGQLRRLTARQIVSLVVLANSVAAVPQTADAQASESVSASSAPVSAGSTDGVTAK